MKKKLVVLLVSFCTLYSCSKDDDPSIQDSQLELSLSVPESGGVQLFASLNGISTSGKETFGFLVSRVNPPTIENSENYAAQASNNQFRAEVSTDLVYNEEYYVKAYIRKSETDFLYSEQKSFVSLGGKKPEIFEATKAHILDTVRIKGKHFGSKINHIKVLFGEVRGNVVNVNDSIINCIVPVQLKDHNPSITVTNLEKSSTFEGFSLFSPEIFEATPVNASLGDIITLRGNHFDIVDQRNIVRIEGKEVQILSSSREAIEFVLPLSLTSSKVTVEVESQLQQVSTSNVVTINAPQIDSAPSKFQAYENIEITGKDFSAVKEDNRVFFNENEAQVLEATKSTLKVKVPIGTYKDRNPKLRIELMDHSVTYEGEMELTDVWLLKTRLRSNHTFRGAHHFIHNDIAYLFEKNEEGAKFNVYRFDPSSETWTNFSIDYPRANIRQEAFSILYHNESKRIYFYFSGEKDNFYEYSLSSKSFIPKKDYPDSVRNNPAVFSIKDKLYLGLGRAVSIYSPVDREHYTHLWQYDVGTDNWSQMKSFPHYRERTEQSIFVINGAAYMGNGALDTGAYDFWRFDPEPNEWKRMADFPDARYDTSFFMNEGNAYVVYGTAVGSSPDVNIFKYNPKINEWTASGGINELYYTPFIFPDGSIALEFSDKVYVGLYSYPYLEFFEADLNRLD